MYCLIEILRPTDFFHLHAGTYAPSSCSLCAISSTLHVHSLLLNSYLSIIGRIRILHAAPTNTRPKTPLISFCTVQLHLYVCSFATLCLSTTSRPGPGELPGVWGPRSFAMPLFLRKDRVATTKIIKIMTTAYHKW